MTAQDNVTSALAAGGKVDAAALAALTNDLHTLPLLTADAKKMLVDKKKQGDAVAFLECIASACGDESNKDSSLRAYHTQLALGLFEELIPLSADAKLGTGVKKVLDAAVVGAVKHAPALLSLFLPPVLEAVENPPQKKWKARVCALDLLLQCGSASDGGLLSQLSCHCPKQLRASMACLVRVLVLCSKESRAEIQKSSSKLLEQVGLLVKCDEIRKISDKIINCLKNFGNMKLAQETLYLIANTTFLSYVDAASFALLFPIVERAMKERQFESKKNGIMIVGAAVVLIEDPQILEAYLPTLLPVLKNLALDPIFEIQREAAKSLGSLGKNMPELLETDLLPWALSKLESREGDSHHSANERTGAAHSLSEMLSVSTDKSLLARVFGDVVRPRALCVEKATNSFPERRQGAFALIEFLCKVDAFEGLAKECALSYALVGLQDESPLVHNAALAAGEAIINNFGGNNADSFVQPLADAVLSFAAEPRVSSLSAKAMAIALYRRLIERVSEFRKYGTDMMSMDCASLRTRLCFLCLLLITRTDAEAEVRRQSNKVLQEQLQSLGKAKKDAMDNLLGCLKLLLSAADGAADADKGFAAARKAAAERCLEDLRQGKGDDFSEERWESVLVEKHNVFNLYQWTGLRDITDAQRSMLTRAEGPCVKVRFAGHHADEPLSPRAGEDFSVEWRELGALTKKVLKRTFAEELAEKTTPLAEAAIVSAVLDSLTAHEAAGKVADCHVILAPSGENAIFEKLEKSVLLEQVYAFYHPKELKQLENPEEILCHVENLMLMYGGGHMLLKDTTFELRKGKRYGVVGRNGTGKTTLMSLIATGGVPGIPKEMTSIHVKPEVLDKYMSIRCKKFMAIDNPGREEAELEATLRKVMFPEELWNSTIGELSGGWRMRLLIAGAMMKKADVLLLDEPTNHLDVSAVKWLSDYLVGLTDSAIMVISHDPIFLNRVCTNVINYNSGKLVYYEGNFDAFTAKLGINAADADALLAGQVAVSENGVERGGAGPGEMGAKGESGASSTAGGDSETVPSLTPAVSIASLLPKGDSSANISGLKNVGSLASVVSQLSAQSSVGDDDDDESPNADGGAKNNNPDRKAKIVFPIAGKVKGLTSLAKPVLEISNLTYAYSAEKGDVIKGVSGKITMNSRIHIKGVNGAGKTTFMNMVCGEVHPNASALPQKGSVNRHRNCRLAYMAQQHMHHMSEFMEVSPYIYIQKRYANGCDAALQERLMNPKTPEEAEERAEKAKQFGKYGKALKNLVSRQQRGKEFVYEAQWEGLDDSSKNTWLTMKDLVNLGCESYALAYDDRQAAQEGGIDQRPLSQREIVKHLEQFGITEELALNRNIGMFSAGQKSKVSLAAAFWIKPHLVALDEPTNYIDMETLDALTIALQRFKGGVICISHCAEFAEKVCNEVWMLEGGGLTITKTKDEKKK